MKICSILFVFKSESDSNQHKICSAFCQRDCQRTAWRQGANCLESSVAGQSSGQFEPDWRRYESMLASGMCAYMYIFNPLTPTAIQKLLEIIDRVRLYPSCSFATALDSDINQTTRLGWSSEYVRKSMYACRSVSVACRPAEKRRRRGEIGSIRR